MEIKIINLKEVQKIFVIGDIHGEFDTLIHNLKIRLKFNKKLFNKKDKFVDKFEKKLRRNDTSDSSFFRTPDLEYIKSNSFHDCVIFVCGDCGFGFNKDSYYTQKLENFNNLLMTTNTHLFFIRGNHDDPRFFNNNILGLSNIECLQDYTVVQTKDYSTLCVGGAISVDRTWRKIQEERINRFNKNSYKKLYWEDEKPIYDWKKLTKIRMMGIKINSVITHSSPSFALTNNNKDIAVKEWSNNDETLLDDVKEERLVFDKLYEYLIGKSNIPQWWCFGHYHLDYMKVHNCTIFKCNDCNFKAFNIDKLKNERYLYRK